VVESGAVLVRLRGRSESAESDACAEAEGLAFLDFETKAVGCALGGDSFPSASTSMTVCRAAEASGAGSWLSVRSKSNTLGAAAWPLPGAAALEATGDSTLRVRRDALGVERGLGAGDEVGVERSALPLRKRDATASSVLLSAPFTVGCCSCACSVAFGGDALSFFLRLDERLCCAEVGGGAAAAVSSQERSGAGTTRFAGTVGGGGGAPLRTAAPAEAEAEADAEAAEAAAARTGEVRSSEGVGVAASTRASESWSLS
jgi:hypothetical protein